jgi:glycosyltransferase involved in cell wall biosynthesis
MYKREGMFRRVERRAVRPAAPVMAPSQTPETFIARQNGEADVVWQGVFRGLSGYKKANFEILMRAANTVRISAIEDIDPPDYNDYQFQRFLVHKRVAVHKNAPKVRFFGPVKEQEDRYRVNYTMMETETVHPDMIALMNENYQEVWTPTRWNAEAFRSSGLKRPVRVMPLGVNQHIYRPGPRADLPECTLLTTGAAGQTEVPRGFIFVYCFLPSFRKGLDILMPAFEEAFGGDASTSLVLAVTHRPSFLADPDLDEPKRHYRSRIYTLTGTYTEREMARIYRSCDAYVTSSRGEGWNLPMCEAAACGLPVVAPRNSAHAELLDDTTAFMFDTEGTAVWEDGQKVSPWYKGVKFSVLGARSKAQLVEQLRRVRTDREAAANRAARFCDLVRSKYTWDRAAAHVVERLLEITA